MKTFEDFKKLTKSDLGSTITIRGTSQFTGIVIGYDSKNVYIGGEKFSYDALSKFQIKIGDSWLPLDRSEESVVAKPKHNRFKTGKSYVYTNSEGEDVEVLINVKFKDPEDGLIKVVNDGQFVNVVLKHPNGDEYIKYIGCHGLEAANEKDF